MQPVRRCRKTIKVVDLFCGIGGLTHGMVLEGFRVVAGVDNDGSCKYAFEKNNRAKFIEKDISNLSVSELNRLFGKRSIKVLVGCAPCQPFSSLVQEKSAYKTEDNRWKPLYRFAKLIAAVRPEIVSMENVPELSNEKKYPVFGKFVRTLKRCGYKVQCKTVDMSRYGVPQKRRRLIMLASRLGDISLMPETRTDHNLRTVRDVIRRLRPLRDGQIDPKDPIHRASKLSSMNKKRILATPENGGSAKAWRKSLIPACYRRRSGRTYMASVYGRMRWDDPAPTVTTNCMTLGAGRNGHPSQHRAISLREAALFQTFPKYYKFAEPKGIRPSRLAKHLGNALPVLFGRVIARSIRKHIGDYRRQVRPASGGRHDRFRQKRK